MLTYHESGNRRKHALPREEEVRLAEEGVDYVTTKMRSLLIDISSANALDYRSHPDIELANSLVWIYVQMCPDRVRSNIRILMACKGLYSIKQLAHAVRMNASFIGLILNMEDARGFGGWNVDTVFKLAKALDARPDRLLEADLSQTVRGQVLDSQLP